MRTVLKSHVSTDPYTKTKGKGLLTFRSLTLRKFVLRAETEFFSAYSLTGNFHKPEFLSLHILIDQTLYCPSPLYLKKFIKRDYWTCEIKGLNHSLYIIHTCCFFRFGFAISQCHYRVPSIWACYQFCHLSFHYKSLNQIIFSSILQMKCLVQGHRSNVIVALSLNLVYYITHM